MKEKLHYPFVIGQKYLISDLLDFEEKLRDLRKKSDKNLNLLKSSKGNRWINHRRDEIIPLLHFVEHRNLDKSSEIELVDQRGDERDIDIKLETDGCRLNLQITTAYFDWKIANGNGVMHPGHYNSKKIEYLLEYGCVGLSDLDADGMLSKDFRCYDNSEGFAALSEAINAALLNKFGSNYISSNINLLVYVVDAYIYVSEYDFRIIAQKCAQIIYAAFQKISTRLLYTPDMVDTTIKSLDKSLYFILLL